MTHATDQHSQGSPTVYLETFGCQMNELDSELVRGQLTALGYRMTREGLDADIVLLNTCSVREQAENKALSRVGLVGVQKAEGRNVVLGFIGCMAEREGERLLSRYPQIDLLCGPGELDRLPMLIDNARKTGGVDRADIVALQGNNHRRTRTLAAAGDNLEMLDLSRAFDPDRAAAGGRSAYVRITRGCNKFCTYCVVPYTRGAEVHRPPDHIVEECKQLADSGVIEVTLLGQTVNHYRYTHGTAVTVDGKQAAQVGPGLAAFRAGSTGRTTSFADLLHRIHEEVPAIQRLRFVTSYPRDFGDDILAVMQASPRICRYLHVPVQSGSDTVLKRMNRGYTVGEYLEFIDRARSFLPDVSIAGDIIVGFPGETDEDFDLTVDLVRRVRFKNNFIFKYSPRPGTTAIDRFEDDVPLDVKRDRNNRLLAVQSEVSQLVHADYVGKSVDVFVEQVSRREAKRGGAPGGVELRWERPETGRIQLSGRTPGDLIVAFDAPDGPEAAHMIGTIEKIRIREARPLLLLGDRETPEGPLSGGRSEIWQAG